MNKKLKLALIRCSSEQGFALPVALGLGVIMLLIASMMIMRAQGDQVSALAQKGTAQSLAIAEGGVSRTLAQLNQSNPNFNFLLKLTYDPNGLLGSALNEWISANMPLCVTVVTVSPILSGTIGDSTYQVLAYRYDAATKKGTLLVEGLVPTGTSSRSRIQQTFNVDPKPRSLIGVLGINKISLGNNDITGNYGNVACNTGAGNCVVSCPYTNASARSAIGAGPQADISGNIFLGPIKTPVIPTMPPVWNGTGTPPTTAFAIPLGNYIAILNES